MAATAESPNTVRAQARWVRMSARKARLVLDNVRGLTVPEARTVLAFTPRAAAREIDRVLASAVANAESAHGLDGDELVVLEAYADEGPTLKRWRARARGRVNRIKKRTCHITIVVAESPKSGRPRPQKPAKPAAEQAPHAGDSGCRGAARGGEAEAPLGGEEEGRSGRLMALTSATSRGRSTAATRRHASSSVAPVASSYERSLRPSLACVSPPATTICNGGQR